MTPTPENIEIAERIAKILFPLASEAKVQVLAILASAAQVDDDWDGFRQMVETIEHKVTITMYPRSPEQA